MAFDEKMLRAAAAVELKSEGKSQKEIAKLMGLEQSTISRALADAKTIADLNLQLIWKTEPDPNDKKKIRKMKFPDLDKFESGLRKIAAERNLVPPTSVKILHSSGGPGDEDEFGKEAAQPTAQLIRKSKLCAVAWGKTLDSVVSSMGKRARVPGLRFIPVSGQPLNSHEPGSSPSSLADDLSNIYGISKKKSHRPLLHGVPARLPKGMNKQIKTIKNFVRFCEDYCKIFGKSETDDTALMNHVDMVLSGIGDPKSSREDPWYKDIQLLEGRDDLHKIASGNIGGVWLPKSFDAPQEIEAVRKMNSRSLGITRNQLKACAKRAASGKVPGVVVLAREPAKADILLSTVGLVNHYIITKDLFDAAMSEISVETRGS